MILRFSHFMNTRMDDTELILLAQSLYAHTRLLPLHSGLNEHYLQESDLSYRFV